MSSYIAIVLICAASQGQDACTERTAIDAMSTKVRSEVACTMGWQEIIARSALRHELGSTTYLKTVCRRMAPLKNTPPAN
jgi:hypothetical protein